MAASNLNISGYCCDFVDSVKEEHYCQLCHLVAKDPHITSCCGEHFCKSCLTPVIEQKQPCPSCCTEEFTSMLNVKYKQEILKLKVFCTQRKRGCEWSGPLFDLSTHTNPSQGDCQFLEDLCPKGCGQKVTKNDLEGHLADECFQRQYTCPFCNYKDTYEVVSNQHTPKCPYIPIRCPNFCGVTCERATLEMHMQICPLEKVQCQYHFAGCKEAILRNDIDNHMKNFLNQHLALLNTEYGTMKIQFQKQLEENAQDIIDLKKLLLKDQLVKQRQIEKLTQKVEELTATLRETTDFQEKISHVWFPQYIMMCNYRSEKENPHNRWISDYYETNPKGYKYQVVIHPNGVGEGAGTHISVSLAPCMSVCDSKTKWPAKCAITFQLINQFHDQDHLTLSETLSWNRPTSTSSLINIRRLFVKHSDLEWNVKKQTQYLHEDTLQFRIAKIIVLSN